ncbi:hypothetical protein FS827_10650 [Agrobacterium vitis]|nr:hypothetical protein [Allorhizobium ampelinum]MVA74270.1 hypothetical protein [Agrobacterium vitis]
MCRFPEPALISYVGCYQKRSSAPFRLAILSTALHETDSHGWTNGCKILFRLPALLIAKRRSSALKTARTGSDFLCACRREKHVVFANILASPEGIKRVSARYPHVTIVSSSIEQQLNQEAFMIPGIGDFGDRYFGTISSGGQNGQQVEAAV